MQTLTNRIAKHETDVGNWYNVIQIYSKTEDTANVIANGSTVYQKAAITVPAGTYIVIRSINRATDAYEAHVCDYRVGTKSSDNTLSNNMNLGQVAQHISIVKLSAQTSLNTWFVIYKSGGSSTGKPTIRATTTAIRIK